MMDTVEEVIQRWDSYEYKDSPAIRMEIQGFLKELKEALMTESELKLPIEVVVNRFIKKPMLMINPKHHAKLIEISTRAEYEVEMWKFRRILEGLEEAS